MTGGNFVRCRLGDLEGEGPLQLEGCVLPERQRPGRVCNQAAEKTPAMIRSGNASPVLRSIRQVYFLLVVAGLALLADSSDPNSGPAKVFAGGGGAEFTL